MVIRWLIQCREPTCGLGEVTGYGLQGTGRGAGAGVTMRFSPIAPDDNPVVDLMSRVNHRVITTVLHDATHSDAITQRYSPRRQCNTMQHTAPESTGW